MNLSYEFSVGSVRAREKSLLTSADIERLLACKSESELCSALSDKGYGEGRDVDALIASHGEAVWKYLRGISPDFGIFDPFIIQNDVHNLKVILKGTMSARKYDHLLIEPRTIDTELLKQAVEGRKGSLLPEWISEASDRAYDLISKKGDARESDAVIDKAAMEHMLRLASQWKSPFLKEYFNTLVFYNNIKIALRCSKTRVNRDFLEDALCEVRDFRRDEVINAVLKGGEALITLLSKCSEYGLDKAMEEYKTSPSLFEKYVDNRLIKLSRDCCKRTSEGAEPLLGYYLGSEAEKKVIHIISSGIRTKTDSETVRERLRDIYG